MIKKGTHWWSFFDLHTKKKSFYLIVLVLKASKNLSSIMIVYGIEKFDQKDNKTALITLKFSTLEYEKIRKKNRSTDTAIDLLHLINKFEKSHKLKNEATLHFVDDQLQMVEKDTCGMYQLYFYVNLFNPLEDSSFVNEKSLSKQTIEKLLNEILTTDRHENERKIEKFADENDIHRGYKGVFKTCLRITISFYKKLLASDRFFFIPIKKCRNQMMR